MSRRHIATHAYDFRRGWVRVSPTEVTPDYALHLRDEGFTIVRSRRGWFGMRELPVSWYIPRSDPDTADPTGSADAAPEAASSTLRERLDIGRDAAPETPVPDPATPRTRRARQRADDGDE
ncbi:hypothetical protein [Microbacterium sp. T32]|uniref:hypothetical protein n=1 Tax=Microbacterium sp. T32 TaxID=1776083 RepID=UPI0007AB90AE|nr:hypothetical protein [Microbacterium sp. T32]KZE37684.1 hypothetical protein AVW09_05220 [Microbacterium sp. T32]